MVKSSNMKSWSIKKNEFERVEVSILSTPEETEGYDWVPVSISVNSGGFSGSVQANFLASEMIKFRDDLLILNNNLQGQAIFQTIEDQLKLNLSVDPSGHVKVDGMLIHVAGVGRNQLSFSFDIDQTYLTKIILELEKSLS